MNRTLSMLAATAIAASATGLGVTLAAPANAADVCFGAARATIDLNKPGHANPNRPQADVILGTPGDDIIHTGGGEDVVCGGEGNDYIIGGSDGLKDTLLGGAGNDFIEGGGGPDRLWGGAGRDVIFGGSDKDPRLDGKDWLYGGGGNDVLYPGDQDLDDIVSGGAGRDQVSFFSVGGPVTVSLAVTSAQDTRSAGVDTISGVEVVIGSGYSDVLRGSGANDTIRGMGGNDRIAAGLGTDVCDGGAGTDTASGCETVRNVP